MVKVVNAEDNPDHEKREAQLERDRAEIAKRNAQNAQAASEENNRDAIERDSKVGGGPAGLNTGPSNTVDSNPRGSGIGGATGALGGGQGRVAPGAASLPTGGTGLSPAQGAQVTSDKPDYVKPYEQRAAVNPGDEAQAQAKQSAGEHAAAREAERTAQGDLDQASKSIADSQSKPAPDQRRDENKRD